MVKEDMMKLTKRSNIWLHFSDYGSDRAKCNSCSSILSTKGGSTSNLRRHSLARHNRVIGLKKSKEELNFDKMEEATKNYDVKLEKEEIIIENENESGLFLETFTDDDTMQATEVIIENEVEEIKPKSPDARRSHTWTYFSQVSKDVWKCKLCGGYISTKGGPNSNLRRHMKGRHDDVPLEKEYTPESKDILSSTQEIPGEMIVLQECTDQQFQSEVTYEEFPDGIEMFIDSSNVQDDNIEWKEKSAPSSKPNILRHNTNTTATQVKSVTIPIVQQKKEQCSIKNKPILKKMKLDTGGDHGNGNSDHVYASSSNPNVNKGNGEKKTEALFLIANNLGRLATAFEKFVEELIPKEKCNNNEQVITVGVGSNIHGMIMKVLNDEAVVTNENVTIQTENESTPSINLQNGYKAVVKSLNLFSKNQNYMEDNQ